MSCVKLTDLYGIHKLLVKVNTPDRRQSKTLITIYERGSKTTRNSVFHCHLSPVDSINAFDCRLSGVVNKAHIKLIKISKLSKYKIVCVLLKEPFSVSIIS